MLGRNLSISSSNALRVECILLRNPCRLRATQRTAARASGSSRAGQARPSRSKGRAFSTAGPTRSSSDSPLRVSYLLGALLAFGVGATSWGLYEFYTALTMWPKEVRGDLRAGLRAKQRGDMKLARRHLEKAWETVQSIDPELLSPGPYLKYSGVAIVLAEVLEAEQDLEEAFNVLGKALVSFVDAQNPSSTVSLTPPSDSQTTPPTSSKPGSGSTSSPHWTSSPPRVSVRALFDLGRASTIRSKLNSKARMRAVALALKLGDLAESLNKPEEEERWLGFAVTEVVRLIRDEYGLVFDSRRGFSQTSSSTSSASGGKTYDEGSTKEGHDHNTSVRDILSPDSDDELGLPKWVSLTKSELAAPMERLGAFYGRHGKYENAIALYRIASSLLVRRKSQTGNDGSSLASITELCQALQIENAHMALMMELSRTRPEDPTIQRDLRSVLSRAMRIYEEAVKQNGRANSQDESVGSGESEMTLCDETFPALFYNAGVYYEELGELEQAFRSYSLSYKALRVKGTSQEMMYEVLESARRVQRAIKKGTQQVPRDPAQNGAATPLTDSQDPSGRQ